MNCFREIAARQNDLALSSAQDKVRQLEKDFEDRVSAARAGITMQEAARTKAKVAAETAQRNIDSMTLKAKTSRLCGAAAEHAGQLQLGQLSARAAGRRQRRAGMAVAQIPDLKNWEVGAHRRAGSRSPHGRTEGRRRRGRAARAKVHGHGQSIGGTTGPPWDRRFECTIALDNPTPELRPGMSVRMVITTQLMNDVLWLPSQALFESDGRTFVYVTAGQQLHARTM